MNTEKPKKIIEFDRARNRNKGKGGSRPYDSILFEQPSDRLSDAELMAPEFFSDLNCDQFVEAVTAGREEYNLKPLFYGILRRVDAVRYRHEVMQDLENAAVLEPVRSFAKRMREMREYLTRSKKLYYELQRQTWFLDAVKIYCDAVNALAKELADSNLQSRGLSRFREYVAEYGVSASFSKLLTETKKRKADLATIEYCVLARSDRFTVRKYEGEDDYSVDVERTFEKFKQGAAKDYRVGFSESEEMDHVEGKILEFVARLHPEVFGPLSEYCLENAGFLNEALAAFDREVQFYLAYSAYVARLKRVGLCFCYPRVSDKQKEVFSYDGFDIVLAHKLANQSSTAVCNDFQLKEPERVMVISGPNQGGKTTFARTFGQLHYLASIGCPVPGRNAQLFLFDKMFTHFEKQEKVESHRGKLEDDLVRIHHILERATPQSIIILNEIFTSTTIKDEVYLSKKLMDKIASLDLLCCWVTFVDELASYGPQTVSMTSTVLPDNPAVRTFKVLRRPADGLAYAMAIAQKYQLTYGSITERIKS